MFPDQDETSPLTAAFSAPLHAAREKVLSPTHFYISYIVTGWPHPLHTLSSPFYPYPYRNRNRNPKSNLKRRTNAKRNVQNTEKKL